MKKFLLSLVALMAVSVNAQDIKFAMDVVEVRQGGSVAVPINIVNTIDCYAWEAVIGVQGVNVLNGDVKFSNYQRADRVQNIAYTKITIDEETGEIIGSEPRTDGAFDIPYEPQKEEDGTYSWKITGYNTGGFAMKENSGAVAYITFTVPETVEVGKTFTGYMKGIHFGKADGTDVAQDDITFTIKVVENVITLDENSTELPEIASNQNVIVKRTINANEWSTICLPFAMTADQVKAAFGDDVKLADFTGYDFDDEAQSITINFSSISSIDANHPCIIKVTSAISEFSVNGVDIDPEETPEINLGDKRNYKKIVGTNVADFDFYNNAKSTPIYLSANKFWYASESTKHMKAFRAYFDLKDELDNFDVAGVKMNLDGIVTNINGLNIINTIEGVYTMDGKKMNNDVTRLPKGVYFINGKKVAVK